MAGVGIELGRDPFQRELTPYEILGLGREAGSADVDRAFREGLLQRRHVTKLTGAKIALERPVERGLTDLFLYQPEALRILRPAPLLDPPCLEPPRRAETAREWEAQFRVQFPDLRLAHSLAVLWYWWALAEPQPGDPAREDRCRRAIGYWAMLVAHDDFWSNTPTLAGTPPELRAALVERLSQDLRKLPALADAPSGDCADLEVLFQHECESARELFGTGANTRYGRVACGPLLLRHCGMLAPVRARVDEALAANPADEPMLRLRELLSDFSQIRALLAARKPADALAAIARLSEASADQPPDAKDSEEIAELRSRACLEFGREQASLNHLDQAIASWLQGLRTARGATERELRSEFAAATSTRAAALARRPAEAIALLEEAVGVVDDESLRLALAELIERRGMQVAVEVQQRLEGDRVPGKALLEDLGRALVDLDRAERLGSERAREDQTFARDLIAQATAAAETVDVLKEMVREGGAVPALRERLAILLCNRSVETAERAVQLAASVPVKLTRARDRALAQMRARRDQRGPRSGVRCDMCAGTGGGQFSTLELPSEPRFTLCHACAKRAKTLGLRAKSEDPVPLLASAELELNEALALDPSSAVIQKNLEDVRQLRRTLEQDPTAARQSASPRTYVDLLLLLAFALALVLFLLRSL